ncbi:MAG TPA: hypothetical protein VLC95_14395 [Anaerolineae bacterium]|nr:hypothetical protein [Anaerolineae bacterium]
MHQPVAALIVAEPGRLRDAWRALLLAVPGISQVTMANDAAAAVGLLELRHPTLVLVDGDLPGGAVPLLGQIKRLQPGARCILLACCTGHEPQPGEMHADAVLVKGFPAARLFETVSQVLSGT